jgi:transglutaminase-like putative cysteine protease
MFFHQTRVVLTLLLLHCTVAFAQYKPSCTVVKNHVQFEINSDASYSQWIEVEYRIDTEQGVQALGERKIVFNSTLADVEVLEAYTLQADGTRLDVPLDKIRTQDESNDDGAIYSDSKSKVIIYPKLEIGSHVYYRAKFVQHTPEFPGHFFYGYHFSPHFKYDHSSIELKHPAGLPLGVDVKGMQGGLIPSDGQSHQVHYKFTFNQPQALPAEESQADLSDFAPYFSASTFASYADLAKAYQQRAQDKTVVTPAIQKLADELIRQAQAQTTLEKVKVLHHWVSQNIRYLGIYVGAGGYVPHDAQSILDNRYGDCKDHVVILEALLQAVGIESSPVLINSSSAYLLPTLPTPGIFDHVITYVPSLQTYLDSTSRFAPVGTLPIGDIDKPVLIVSTGQLGRTPMTHHRQDRTEVRVQMQLLSDGRVKGQSQSTLHGVFEVISRGAYFNHLNDNQVDRVNSLLSQFQETGSGSIAPRDPTHFNQPWGLDASFELDPVVNVPGPSAMNIPMGLVPGQIKYLSRIVPVIDRKFPTTCHSTQHEEWIELSFPHEMKITRIPQNVQFASGTLRYTSRYELKHNTLKINRTFYSVRTQSICGPESDKWYDDFTKVVRRDLRQQVFFQ